MQMESFFLIMTTVVTLSASGALLGNDGDKASKEDKEVVVKDEEPKEDEQPSA